MAANRTTESPIGTPLDDNQRALAGQYIPWARKVAMPFKEEYPRQRDLIDSVALEALVDAAGTFEKSNRGHADRPANFETWARLKVEGRVRDFLKAENLRKKTSRGLDTLGPRELDPTTVLDQLARREHLSDAERRVADVHDRLDPEDAEPLKLVYLDGVSIREAAGRLGLNFGEMTTRLAKAKKAARAAAG